MAYYNYQSLHCYQQKLEGFEFFASCICSCLPTAEEKCYQYKCRKVYRKCLP